VVQEDFMRDHPREVKLTRRRLVAGASAGTLVVEHFLEECRADPFFQDNPNGVDRIEDLLTRFYHEADESPAWQELWDRMRGIITQKAPFSSLT
jgi:hypothetical protein